jgi:cyclic dehypoxanthinyl futalosine synthase
VCLFHRVPVERVRRVAVDTSSRASAGLVRVLLHTRLGRDPEYVPMAPGLDRMLEEADAALLIGDPALDAVSDVPRLDLGEEWTRLTGLPFVYAFWAGPAGVVNAGGVKRLQQALASGLESLSAIAARQAGGDAARAARYESYLRENIVYALGEREQEGLREFLRRAHALSLVPELPELRFHARLDETRRKVEDGVRLSREEGVALLRDADLLELGALADTCAGASIPKPVVTYIIDRNINYTNVCNAQCAFCAFYRDLPSKQGYLLSKPQLAQKIEETIALGGRQILLQGGLHPDLGIEYYEELFRWMKASYPIWIHGLSPAEVQHIVRVSKLGLEQTLRRLMAAGLDSIPGGGAEILSDRVRKIIGIAKGSTSEWLEVMEMAHRLGMRTTATMMFGHVETLEERIDHLLHLRDLPGPHGRLHGLHRLDLPARRTPRSRARSSRRSSTCARWPSPA